MEGSNILIQSLEWMLAKWTDYISPFVIVRGYEGAVLLELGKFKRVLTNKINFKLPFIHEVHKCLIKPETVSVDITITTVDGHTMQIEVIGEYEVVDVRKWILEANDAASNAKDLLRGWAADIAVDTTAEELNKKPVKTKIKNKLNEEMSSLGAKFNKILFGKIALTRSFALSGVIPSPTSLGLML